MSLKVSEDLKSTNPLKLKKFKALKDFCHQKLVDQDFARFENHFLIKNNENLSEKLEQLQFKSSRQPEDEKFFVNFAATFFNFV